MLQQVYLTMCHVCTVCTVDADSIPTMNVLQGGLLNDEGYLREFFLFIKRLLKCATTDPGFVNAKEVSVSQNVRLKFSLVICVNANKYSVTFLSQNVFGEAFLC